MVQHSWSVNIPVPPHSTLQTCLSVYPPGLFPLHKDVHFVHTLRHICGCIFCIPIYGWNAHCFLYSYFTFSYKWHHPTNMILPLTFFTILMWAWFMLGLGLLSGVYLASPLLVITSLTSGIFLSPSVPRWTSCESACAFVLASVQSRVQGVWQLGWGAGMFHILIDRAKLLLSGFQAAHFPPWRQQQRRHPQLLWLCLFKATLWGLKTAAMKAAHVHQTLTVGRTLCQGLDVSSL